MQDKLSELQETTQQDEADPKAPDPTSEDFVDKYRKWTANEVLVQAAKTKTAKLMPGEGEDAEDLPNASQVCYFCNGDIIKEIDSYTTVSSHPTGKNSMELHFHDDPSEGLDCFLSWKWKTAVPFSVTKALQTLGVLRVGGDE